MISVASACVSSTWLAVSNTDMSVKIVYVAGHTCVSVSHQCLENMSDVVVRD